MLITKIHGYNITNLELGKWYEINLIDRKVLLMRGGSDSNSEMVEFVTGIDGSLMTANCYLNQINGSEGIGYLKFFSIPLNGSGKLSIKARQTFEEVKMLKQTGLVSSL